MLRCETKLEMNLERCKTFSIQYNKAGKPIGEIAREINLHSGTKMDRETIPVTLLPFPACNQQPGEYSGPDLSDASLRPRLSLSSTKLALFHFNHYWTIDFRNDNFKYFIFFYDMSLFLQLMVGVKE